MLIRANDTKLETLGHVESSAAAMQQQLGRSNLVQGHSQLGFTTPLPSLKLEVATIAHAASLAYAGNLVKIRPPTLICD